MSIFKKKKHTQEPENEKKENSFLGATGAFFLGKEEEKESLSHSPTLEARKIPEQVPRYQPDLKEGLTEEQVHNRMEAGLVNKNNNKGKSIGRIFYENIVTYFNMILLAIAIVLVIFRQWTQLTFLVIATINTIIGISQEIKAKQTLDKLKLVTSSNVEVIRGKTSQVIPADQLVLDDIYSVKIGDQIPTDSILLEGKLEINESLLTGESLPVSKKAGDKIFAGSYVVSGSAKVRADMIGEYNYVAGIQNKAKELTKPKSELVRSLNLIIKVIGLAIIPLGALTFWSQWMAFYGTAASAADAAGSVVDKYEVAVSAVKATAGSMIGMIPSGMYLLTSVALASSVVTLSKKNAMVQDLYSVEMLARVNVLCLDKTGTLTDGTMRVDEVLVIDDSYDIKKLMGSYLGAFKESNQTSLALSKRYPLSRDYAAVRSLPFSSARKYSAVELKDMGTFSLGAPEYLFKTKDKTINNYIAGKEAQGYRVVVICHNDNPLTEGEEISGKNSPIAIFSLQDHIREQASQTIRWFVDNGVAIKIISGDNPLTASEIAKKCGVPEAEKCVSLEGLTEQEVNEIVNDHTVFGRVSPEQKATIIRQLKREGKTVGMTGDGVNDILAMKNSDCSVAMANGSQAARNSANLVLLDSNFASMPAAVQEGRRAINNVQRSSSLYLMKTIFTAVFTIIVLVTSLGFPISYPFEPNNLLITEMICIGFVSIFLSVQKNNDPISGNFLRNIFIRSVPAGFCLVMAIGLNYLFRYLPGNLLDLDFGVNGALTEASSYAFTTFNSLSMSVVALGMDYNLCEPFFPLNNHSLNRYRFIMFCLTILFFCIMAFVFPYLPATSGNYNNLCDQMVGIDFRSMNKTMWLLLILYLFGFYALLSFLTKSFQQAGENREKEKQKKENQPLEEKQNA